MEVGKEIFVVFMEVSKEIFVVTGCLGVRIRGQ
jgi:hypothetical protein